jgi:hypothetical protein
VVVCGRTPCHCVLIDFLMFVWHLQWCGVGCLKSHVHCILTSPLSLSWCLGCWAAIQIQVPMPFDVCGAHVFAQVPGGAHGFTPVLHLFVCLSELMPIMAKETKPCAFRWRRPCNTCQPTGKLIWLCIYLSIYLLEDECRLFATCDVPPPEVGVWHKNKTSRGELANSHNEPVQT